jgi:hypothetical protein
VIGCWPIGDLAEAAMHMGRVEEARARVRPVEAASGDISGTCISVGLSHARALLAEDDQQAAECVAEALRADLAHWHFQRARPRLAHGQLACSAYAWTQVCGYTAFWEGLVSPEGFQN